MKDLRGKRALVTGAASGIGRCIALALAREGVALFVTDRDEAGLDAVSREASAEGVAVETRLCDLADRAGISAMLSLATERPLNIVVNCAGVVLYGSLHLMTPDEVQKLLAVNLLAPVQIVTELLDRLLQAGDAHIVNVSSFLGLAPIERLVAYQTSKFGLCGFTLSLRIDYCCENFGVTLLCPGFVRTPMLDKSIDRDTGKAPALLPAWLCTTPETVARKTIRAIKRNKGIVVITPLARLAWWFMRLSPRLYDWRRRGAWRSRERVLPGSESR